MELKVPKQITDFSRFSRRNHVNKLNACLCNQCIYLGKTSKQLRDRFGWPSTSDIDNTPVDDNNFNGLWFEESPYRECHYNFNNKKCGLMQHTYSRNIVIPSHVLNKNGKRSLVVDDDLVKSYLMYSCIVRGCDWKACKEHENKPKKTLEYTCPMALLRKKLGIPYEPEKEMFFHNILVRTNVCEGRTIAKQRKIHKIETEWRNNKTTNSEPIQLEEGF